MELGKIPPHDIEAEQAVIGSMLTDKDAIMSAVETLKSEDFYREDNKIIYEAIFKFIQSCRTSRYYNFENRASIYETVRSCWWT